MQSYEYYAPRSLPEALEYLAENTGNCRIIAGGTDLIPALRKEDIHPAHLLNILEIVEARGISETGETVRIGAITTFNDLADSELIRKEFPLLAEMALLVGGPQTRNRGTIGGNISSAAPAADGLPVLLSLDAELELSSRRGKRSLPLNEAITKAWTPAWDDDEMITAIKVNKLPPGTRTKFYKLARRKALARSRMTISLILRSGSGGEIEELRFVPGSVMPVPRRMEEVEKLLTGKVPTDELLDRAARAVGEEMVKVTGIRWSTGYKKPVLGNLFRIVLRQLITAG